MNFNLLDEKSFLSSIAIDDVKTQLDGGEPEQVFKSLEIFKQINVKQELFNYNSKGFVNIPLEFGALNIPIKNFIGISNKLLRLSGYKNFESFGKGYNNPTQVEATNFEVDCCDFIANHFDIENMEFEPEVLKDGSAKYPEAKITLKDELTFFIECKSLSNEGRVKQSKVLKLLKQIQPDIKEHLDPKYRLEISFISLPFHWNRNYSEQLIACFGKLKEKEFVDKHLVLKIDDKYTTWVKLCKITEKQYFKNTLNIGNSPEDGKHTLILGEVPNLIKAIKRNIRDALSQIPDTEYSLIFLYPLNKTYALQAFNEFFKDNENNKLIGAVSWTNKVQLIENPKCDVKLSSRLIKQS